MRFVLYLKLAQPNNAACDKKTKITGPFITYYTDKYHRLV